MIGRLLVFGAIGDLTGRFLCLRLRSCPLPASCRTASPWSARRSEPGMRTPSDGMRLTRWSSTLATSETHW